MRRPLLAAALCVVVIAAARLHTEKASNVPSGYISTKSLEASCELLVTGQIYQKDENSVYLKAVSISDSTANGQSAGTLRQETRFKENGRTYDLAENLICDVDAASEFPLGSWVTLRGVFHPFSSASNPGEFDGEVYYKTLGIGGKLKKTFVLTRGEGVWPVREWLYQMKTLCKKRLYDVFSEKDAAVMSALLLGDKNDLDHGMKDLYKKSGILHIFSISSLHITIIGMGLYQLLRKGGIPVLPAAAAGGILLVMYGCMTGFGVSASRAIGMYLLRMLGKVLGRTYDMLTALGVMAAVMTAGNIYLLLNGGFLLSFTSVLGIGVVYPALFSEKAHPMGDRMGMSKIRRTGIKWSGKFLDSLRQSAIASLSITLTTLPVQLWLYYEIPVYSVFLNLLVIPLLKPLMVTGILTLVPGMGFLAGMDGLILRLYEFLCECFARLSFRTWNPGCPAIWQIVVYYILLSGVVAIRYRQKEMKKYQKGGKGVSVSVLCLLVVVMGIRPSAADSVTFLDVGQGDGIVVRTASGQTYLFDCGSSSRSNVGKYVLMPYLKYHGIHTIDAVFVSHPDKDHVNGVLELLSLGAENGILVRQLVLPAIEEEEREEQLGELRQAAAKASVLQGRFLAVNYLSAGEAWECGSAAFLCLHPEAGFVSESSNGYSECVYVEFRGKRGRDCEKWTLLLTGDVEGRGESELLEELEERGIGNITVLKAAHHGSRNSSSEALLSQTAPKLTVISCGRNNSYGHPHRELLERLEQIDTYIVQTAQLGALTVTYRDGHLQVHTIWKKQ